MFDLKCRACGRKMNKKNRVVFVGTIVQMGNSTTLPPFFRYGKFYHPACYKKVTR